jgi:hypothetical protein
MAVRSGTAEAAHRNANADDDLKGYIYAVLQEAAANFSDTWRLQLDTALAVFKEHMFGAMEAERKRTEANVAEILHRQLGTLEGKLPAVVGSAMVHNGSSLAAMFVDAYDINRGTIEHRMLGSIQAMVTNDLSSIANGVSVLVTNAGSAIVNQVSASGENVIGQVGTTFKAAADRLIAHFVPAAELELEQARQRRASELLIEADRLGTIYSTATTEAHTALANNDHLTAQEYQDVARRAQAMANAARAEAREMTAAPGVESLSRVDAPQA